MYSEFTEWYKKKFLVHSEFTEWYKKSFWCILNLQNGIKNKICPISTFDNAIPNSICAISDFRNAIINAFCCISGFGSIRHYKFCLPLKFGSAIIYTFCPSNIFSNATKQSTILLLKSKILTAQLLIYSTTSLTAESAKESAELRKGCCTKQSQLSLLKSKIPPLNYSSTQILSYISPRKFYPLDDKTHIYTSASLPVAQWMQSYFHCYVQRFGIYRQYLRCN